MGSELGRDVLPAHKSFNTSLILLMSIVPRKYIKVKGLEAKIVGEFPICALIKSQAVCDHWGVITVREGDVSSMDSEWNRSKIPVSQDPKGCGSIAREMHIRTA